MLQQDFVIIISLAQKLEPKVWMYLWVLLRIISQLHLFQICFDYWLLNIIFVFSEVFSSLAGIHLIRFVISYKYIIHNTVAKHNRLQNNQKGTRVGSTKENVVKSSMLWLGLKLFFFGLLSNFYVLTTYIRRRRERS